MNSHRTLTKQQFVVGIFHVVAYCQIKYWKQENIGKNVAKTKSKVLKTEKQEDNFIISVLSGWAIIVLRPHEEEVTDLTKTT